MILPYPVPVKEIRNLPLTMSMVVLNVLIFVLIFSGGGSRLDNTAILNEESLSLTGRLYHQYIHALPTEKQKGLPGWIRKMDVQDAGQRQVLGAFALKDKSFLDQAETYSFRGDEVSISDWRKDLKDFRSLYFSQVLFQFGLSSVKSGPLAWLTYQFSHSGIVHLMSNLLFLVVMGAAVELYFGSAALLLLYLAGGVAGGAGFLFMNPQGMVPMVGASASVSALLAFYALTEWRKRVRFLYFISPIQGQFGIIYLPTLLIIPLFLLVDLANILSTPEGIGSGVAYSAHLGGTACGFLFAGMWRLKENLKNKSALPH